MTDPRQTEIELSADILLQVPGAKRGSQARRADRPRAFPGEEPPQIEYNEDAGGENTDE